ncbi:MAG: hypothetical protein GC171_06425 [Terrimonas sp.]|nr:hypothetical protein [Terrimonas sp.]
MKKLFFHIGIVFFLLAPHFCWGQGRPIDGSVLRNSGFGNTGGRGGGTNIRGGQSNDSLEHRDYSADSLTIFYRIPSSTLATKLDSSIRDFTKKFPIPADHIYLGNLGNPTHSLLFTPFMKAGWDPGFHALDVYKWPLENVRFFNTTKPYTELNYLLGSKTEQLIEVLHTQNIKPNWNALFQYRLINSPGFFKNQKTNHNNYLLSSWYQSPKKRYNNYFVILANKLQSSENGGFRDDQDYFNDRIFKDRFNIPTKLGGDQAAGAGFFSKALDVGNRYNEFTVMLRQQYDLGRKDSLVTDSTIIPLFYPRLRFEHTLTYNAFTYNYTDNIADTNYYAKYYGLSLPNQSDTFSLQDKWKQLINDFSIYQFPDANNLQQYIKLGAALETLKGTFTTGGQSFYNFYGHVEYRNKTKNQKWDMGLNGLLYFGGLNSGDYNARVNLKRYSRKSGAFIELGFENTNRTPSFIFDDRSSFALDNQHSFQKENLTHIQASVYQPRFKLRLSGHYFLVSNMTYYRNYYQPQQENALFNVLQLSAEKVFRLGKHWNWYADVYVQQKTGNVDLNIPVLFTRQRLALEGLFFTNLNVSTGLELRYHTPYKADAYSPVLGRFFYQDSIRITNLPDIAAFLHFRIRSMKVFIRLENLNTVSNKFGFGFYNNNEVSPGYINPGMVMRVGIFWNFVN